LFGIDFAAHYSIREQLRFACIVLGSVIALSIVAEIFFPGLFPHLGPDPSAWQGIFGHKNTLGRIIALAAVAFLSLPRRRNTLVIVTLMVMAGALLVVAHSASSLVELIVLVVISQVLGLLRWTPSKLIVTAFLSLLIAIPTAYLVLTNLDRVAGMLGRDATLTGRTEIWRLASESIARRPILGYGYDVFWDSSSQEGTRIRSAVGWEAPTAHDGYLEVLLDLGFAGLLLYAVACVVTVRRAVILFRRGPASNMIWPLLFMAEVLLSQITESTVIRPNSIFWIMSVAIAFSVSKTPIVLDGTMSDRDPSESLPEAVLAEV
jgi:O-antigen ligase